MSRERTVTLYLHLLSSFDVGNKLGKKLGKDIEAWASVHGVGSMLNACHCTSLPIHHYWGADKQGTAFTSMVVSDPGRVVVEERREACKLSNEHRRPGIQNLPWQ